MPSLVSLCVPTSLLALVLLQSSAGPRLSQFTHPTPPHPHPPPHSPQGCGKENGPCCVASRANRYQVTCDDGLTCISPTDFVYRSTGQHDKLAANFAKAYVDPSVMGKCVRKPKCNVALGPCGVEECPGLNPACPKGYYCANYADATVGSRCLPLPADAGKPGGPCLPNNFPVSRAAEGGHVHTTAGGGGGMCPVQGRPTGDGRELALLRGQQARPPRLSPTRHP